MSISNKSMGYDFVVLSGWWFRIIFFFWLLLTWSNLSIMVQMGWKHKLVLLGEVSVDLTRPHEILCLSQEFKKEKGYLWQLPKTNSWKLKFPCQFSGKYGTWRWVPQKTKKVWSQNPPKSWFKLYISLKILFTVLHTFCGPFGVMLVILETVKPCPTYIMANTHGNIFSIKVKPIFSKNSVSTSGLNDDQVIGVSATLSFHW